MSAGAVFEAIAALKSRAPSKCSFAPRLCTNSATSWISPDAELHTTAQVVRVFKAN